MPHLPQGAPVAPAGSLLPRICCGTRCISRDADMTIRHVLPRMAAVPRQTRGLLSLKRCNALSLTGAGGGRGGGGAQAWPARLARRAAASHRCCCGAP